MNDLISRTKLRYDLGHMPIEDADNKNPCGTVSLEGVFNIIDKLPIYSTETDPEGSETE
jgi:hypothetical protein